LGGQTCYVCLVHVIQQRSPTQTIVMTSPFSPGAGTSLRAAVMVKTLVEEKSRPRCVHAIPQHVMVVQKLPGRSNGPTRVAADLGVADYPVRVWDEGNVISKVVPCEVLHPKGTHEQMLRRRNVLNGTYPRRIRLSL
jgi:hypothetical protein